MKPQLGDTLFNRYTLVTLLRDEPGVQAWKANDRVLAHDCQLFVLTDPSTLEDVSSLATQLGRKNGITPVLQFRKSGEAAVLVTRIETGLSLTEYLNGPASGTISFEAMHSIIGETAAIATALETPRLSTDTIRVSVQGVEIADAPLSGLLAEPTKAPESIQGEQLAIRQLASVLYALLTRRPSAPDTTYDLASLGEIPGEFRVILSRGLELTKEDGSHGEPMLTLSELTALLGDYKPLTDLTDQDIALPSDAGAGSISTAQVRAVDGDTLVELPDTVVTTEKLPDLTINRALTEAEAARHAERVVAEQNKQTFAEMQADFDSYSPSVLGSSSGDQPGRLSADAASRLTHMPDLPERPASSGDAGGYQGDDLFHEFSFQTQALPTASGANPGEETTRIPVFVDPNMATEAIDVSSVRQEMQTAKPSPALPAPKTGAAATDAAGANAAAPHTPDMDATIVGMKPIDHDGGAPVAFAPAPHARGVAATDASTQQPPSFTPKETPAGAVDAATDADNLSKQRLFGKMTTTVAVVIIASVLIVAALAFAVVTFMHSSANPADSGVDKNNQWPSQQNLDDVPFGDESGDGSSNGSSNGSDQSKDSSQSSGASAASDGTIELIDVTDAYQR
ncbi:hypothetical protein [Bifidobacterium stellenboschense]|uniref:Virulence factor MVIN-like protein n=1 Tax=Bifidobacterium stellenboschense TaxID=762211 RepID=A0A087E0X7_9BIFI|nr:hypothetical protein [Bifidobacterium stellenboschense]KFJ01428.1 virulence factor MVIN-like protein [Bifidobacterium stellenboschense]